MKRIYGTFLLLILGTVLAVSAPSQDKTKPAVTSKPISTPASPAKSEPPIRLPNDLIDFFSGEWEGAGEFASGKKIEADISFAPDLDHQWLVYRHTDRPPNRYKALGMWGFEYGSKRFIMVINDNFGGARRFSSEGWLTGKVVFAKIPVLTPPTNAASPAAPTRQERFTFERQDRDTLKMTYETSEDGRSWRLGDYLIFKRKS
jgi:hypothetical protein